MTLSIAADDRTNSIVGMATELMAKDIEKVVEVLEEKAKDSTKVVQLVPTRGIDPLLVQEVVDAIQGRTPANRSRQQGGGPDGQPVRRRQPIRWRVAASAVRASSAAAVVSAADRRWVRRGRRRPVRRSGRPADGRRSRRRRPAAAGGGRGGDAPDPGTTPGLPEVGRGPDFFEQRDMDVPQQTLLYDPYEETMSLRRAGGPARPADPVQVLDAVRLASGDDRSRAAGDLLAQAKRPTRLPPRSRPRRAARST